MNKTTCPSAYAHETDGVTYTCNREAGHPGVHRSDVTRTYATCDVYTGRPTGGTHEEAVMWTDWEAFLGVQRTGSDAEVVAAGAALVAGAEWYADMLTRQPRYATLVGA
ncbi:hypothetical protein ACGF3G_00630 [Streptomyces sp. NPDC048179]|uniref:hypothetical protein n=1 Tax=Streptomyces sp. NPDC048179 TaxID=3365506 RepID=UPI00371797D2